MRRLLLTLSLCLIPALAHAYTTPTLPQLSVDVSMPSTSVTKTVCASGCDYNNSQLQAAIDAAALGTTITLEAGVTYTGASDTGFTLKNKTTGSGWIIIQTNTTLPADGVRVAPADTANFAKILRTTVNSAAMSCEASAHHYRIQGVEFMNPGDLDISTGGGSFVNCDSGAGETSLALQAHHIVFDRVYIHGPPAGHTAGVIYGIVMAGNYQAVINSYIVDIHMTASQPESKAILFAVGAGPLLVNNNFLNAAGENMMLGGSYVRITDLSPSDVTITHNYFYKPLKWRDDAAYNSAPNPVLSKNLFEIKHGKRVLIDGNVFENLWFPNSQSGTAFLLTPRQGDASNLTPWATVQDVTVTNNWFKNVANVFGLSGADGTNCSVLESVGDPDGTGCTQPTTPGGRWLFKNNLITSAGGYSGGGVTAGLIFSIGNSPFDVTIQHNTVASFASAAVLVGKMLSFSDASCSNHPQDRLVLIDNIFLARQYPWFCTGTLTLAGGFTQHNPGYVWTNNIWAGTWPSSGGMNTSGTYVQQGSGNAYPATEATLLYTDAAGGDWSITDTNSPAYHTASDGTNSGVDWTALQAALAGTAPPADTTAPTLTAAFPTIDLPAGTTSTTVTVTSNEAATVKYGLSDVAYGSLPSTTTANGLSFTTAAITGLTNGSSTPVYFRGQDTATNTNLSSLVVTINVAAAPGDTTAPSTVTGLLATPLTGGLSITYTWTAATDNVAVASYQLYLCTPSVCTPTVPTGGQPTSESVTVNGLTANTSYVACVKALDTSGNFSAACSATATVTTLPPLAAPAPATPTGVRTLAAHPSVAKKATFLWTPNTEVDLAGYRIYRRISSGVYTDVYEKQATPASAYADQTPVTQYTFRFTRSGTYCFGIAAFNTSDVESPKTDTCVTGVGLSRTTAGARTSRSPNP